MFQPSKITRERDYKVVEITFEGEKVVDILPFSEAQALRDELQNASTVRLSVKRWALRGLQVNESSC